MSSLFVTSITLRQAARDASAHDELLLPPGEYEGPIVVDRPLRLVGRGDRPEATTLWTRRGPAVIVRSPGVTLTNISIELTLAEARQADATLWYAPGCEPNTQGALVHGRVEPLGMANNSGGWRLPDLIDLGDVWAKHPVTLPMTIEVPAPARLHTEIAIAQVQPDNLPAQGEHIINVSLAGDKLVKDLMVAGQLVIEAGGETRAVWIVARVLDEEFKDWLRDKIILIGKSGRKFGFNATMLLGKEVLKGEPGADALSDRQAFIQKEPSGVWSLIQPLRVGKPLQVNGQPVGIGRRQMLRGGETIELGALKLLVEAKQTDLGISVDGPVQFGKVSQRATAAPPVVTVKNTDQKRSWEGRLRSTVPWIHVPHERVACPGGHSVAVLVQLGSDLSNLPSGVHHGYGALVLEGSTLSWVLTAVVDVDARQTGIDVEPSTVDFGHVIDPSQVPAQRVKLRNQGAMEWRGSIQVTVPWLAVDRTDVQVASGAEQTITVTLTDQVTALTESAHVAPDALKIAGPGGSASVAARLMFERPKVQLDVQPRSIDWDKVMDWRMAASHVVTVRNTGNKGWQGKAESLSPWVDVSPAALSVPPGGQIKLTLQLKQELQNLATGEQKASIARVEGEGLMITVVGRVVVEQAPIEVDATQVSMVLEDRSVLPTASFCVRNRSGQDRRITIKSTLQWLKVTPSDLVCPARGEVMVTVSLSPEVGAIFKRPKQVNVHDAIQLDVGGQPVQVAVSLDVRSPLSSDSIVTPPGGSRTRAGGLGGIPKTQPVPPVASLTVPMQSQAPGLAVDFGDVSEWSGSLPAREIRLANSQPQAMQGIVHSTLPWVEISPRSFTCPPGQAVVIQARLTKAGAALKPRVYDVKDAIVVETGSQNYLVSVRLNVGRAQSNQPLGPQLGQPGGPAELKVDFGAVSDTTSVFPVREVRLANSQAQAAQGTVKSTVPWLEVTPTTFTSRPGQHVVITIKLAPSIANLRPKVYDVSDAVVVESGSQRHLVDVRMELVKGRSSQGGEGGASGDRLPGGAKPEPGTGAQPDPSPPSPEPPPASPWQVDFGVLAERLESMPSREVRLINSSATQTMEGTARSTLPWLEVQPAKFSCPPGQAVVLTISLTKAVIGLRPKQYEVVDAIVVQSQGQHHQVKARLEVVRPWGVKPTVIAPAGPTPKPQPGDPTPPAAPTPRKGEVSAVPEAIEWGTINLRDWAKTPAKEITLVNGLDQEWCGKIASTVLWMDVSPPEVRCPPGGRVVVKIRLARRSPPKARSYKVDDGILIEGDGRRIHVAAHVLVVGP
jgi:hypothetical protein